MSLVGNLEDLSLGDIMQIISLSQKFGVLALEGEHGSGRIVFSSGMVHGASLKGVDGHFSDLRSLVVGSGILDPAGYDACASRADDLGLTIEEMLRSEASLDIERLDELIRDAVEAAVLEMFTWPSGDFSFDVRAGGEEGDPQLVLRTGINSQYLAMEGMRVRDEADRKADSTAPSDAVAAKTLIHDLSAEEMFGVRSDDAHDIDRGEPDPPICDDAGRPASAIDTPEVASEATAATTKRRPLILIDSDLAVLEWGKRALQSDFKQIHVFQQAEQGLMRIRQYLIRGELPVVVISTDAEIDPLSGIRGLGDFVKRLKSQSAKLPIVGWADEERPPSEAIKAHLDGLLDRPAGQRLRDPDGSLDGDRQRALTSALARLLMA